MDRRTLGEAHRLVVKLGTHVVMRDGVTLAVDRLTAIVDSLARLRKDGREGGPVTSGAVGMGSRVLGLTARPRTRAVRQACAAVGQGNLTHVYTGAFAQRR